MEWIILDLPVNLVEFRPRTHKNILIYHIQETSDKTESKPKILEHSGKFGKISACMHANMLFNHKNRKYQIQEFMNVEKKR